MQYRVLQESSDDELRWSFAAEIRAGMVARPRRISSQYFYDDQGSELFEQIMRMPSYYPARCEREIFETHKGALTQSCLAGPTNVVDLGAGDGSKTEILLRELQAANADFVYVPIDISQGAMRTLTERLADAVPGLQVEGLVSDYVSGLRWLRENRADRQNFVLFLGSNIGNFGPAGVLHFLARLRSALRDGDRTLIGFDLKKDIHVIQQAYDDPDGLTAQFNLNLLSRINATFDANFDTSAFGHHAYYNPVSGAAESYVISLRKQRVRIRDLNLEVDFDEYQPIHTEYSHKYLRSDIHQYAGQSGFVVENVVEDDRGWFADSVWRVATLD